MLKTSNKEFLLLKLIRWGIYLTALTPLIIFKEYISPFHFGKVVLFRSLVEILGVAYLLLVLKNRNYLPRRDGLFWSFLIFTAVFTLTTATSVLIYPSFWGTLERMGGLWTFWHYFLFYIILISVINKKEHWQKLLDLTIFVGVLSAFYGFGQKTDISFFIGSGNRARIFGTIGNAALFAGYQLWIVFLSLIMYLRSGEFNDNKKSFYLFALIITSVAVLMTAVRGSILGFAMGILAFTYLWTREYKSYLGKMAVNALIGAMIFWGIFSMIFNDAAFVKNSGYLSRLTNLSLTATTVQTRFWAWQAGIKGWKENPKTILLGWGPENFNIPFAKNFNPKFFRGPGAETLFDRAHNMFIEILVTMGIVGLLAYLNIFIALFNSLRKVMKEKEFFIWGIGLISGTITYIIHNSFIFDTSANLVVFFTIFGFVSYLSSHRNSENNYSKNNTPIIKNNSTVGVLGMLFTFFVLVLLYKTNILAAKANYATTRAIVKGWAGDFNGAFAKYKESLSYDVPGKYEYRHRLAQYLVGMGGPSTKEKSVQDAYKFAIAEVEKNIKENQNDYLPYLYSSRLNIVLGKDDPTSKYNDIALSNSMKALEISPKFIRTYYEIAQAYLNKKDYPKAIEYFQKAVDLNPDAGISHAYLGAAKIEAGNLDGAQDLERALSSPNPYNPRDVDFQRLVNAYLKTKDYGKIAWIYEQLIKTNPDNPQYYASLATSYAQLGKIDEAVAAARKAVQVDPGFLPDARAFVRSLGREL